VSARHAWGVHVLHVCRWIGSKPLPKQVVEKLAKKASAQGEAGKQKAVGGRQASDVAFDPKEFREFVSSFRKSKLRRKSAADEARKKQEREAAKKAGAEKRAKAKSKEEATRRLQDAHRIERASSIRPGKWDARAIRPLELRQPTLVCGISSWGGIPSRGDRRGWHRRALRPEGSERIAYATSHHRI
jgi:hypothetical protein